MRRSVALGLGRAVPDHALLPQPIQKTVPERERLFALIAWQDEHARRIVSVGQCEKGARSIGPNQRSRLWQQWRMYRRSATARVSSLGWLKGIRHGRN